jgi:hypothetical protein
MVKNYTYTNTRFRFVSIPLRVFVSQQYINTVFMNIFYTSHIILTLLY